MPLLILGLLLLVLGDDGWHIGDDLGHVAHSLGPPFPEHKALTLLQKFWMLHKSVKLFKIVICNAYFSSLNLT